MYTLYGRGRPHRHTGRHSRHGGDYLGRFSRPSSRWRNRPIWPPLATVAILADLAAPRHGGDFGTVAILAVLAAPVTVAISAVFGRFDAKRTRQRFRRRPSSVSTARPPPPAAGRGRAVDLRASAAEVPRHVPSPPRAGRANERHFVHLRLVFLERGASPRPAAVGRAALPRAETSPCRETSVK